jgi:hypothetical protein
MAIRPYSGNLKSGLINMPRVKMNIAKKLILFCLQFYLIVLFGLIIYRFVKIF